MPSTRLKANEAERRRRRDRKEESPDFVRLVERQRKTALRARRRGTRVPRPMGYQDVRPSDRKLAARVDEDGRREESSRKRYFATLPAADHVLEERPLRGKGDVRLMVEPGVLCVPWGSERYSGGDTGVPFEKGRDLHDQVHPRPGAVHRRHKLPPENWRRWFARFLHGPGKEISYREVAELKRLAQSCRWLLKESERRVLVVLKTAVLDQKAVESRFSVHKTALPAGVTMYDLKEGQIVACDVVDSPRGPRASSISLVAQSDPEPATA